MAPAAKASANARDFSPLVFSEVAPNASPSADESEELPGEVVDPTSPGPTQTIALQKLFTPSAIRRPAPEALSSANAPLNAPSRMPRFAGAVTGRLPPLDIAEAA